MQMKRRYANRNLAAQPGVPKSALPELTSKEQSKRHGEGWSFLVVAAVSNSTARPSELIARFILRSKTEPQAQEQFLLVARKDEEHAQLPASHS